MMRTLAFLICSALLVSAADVADMSGTWVVNTKRSKWGKRPAPKNVDLVIEHREPSFRYKGTINDSQDMAPTQFEFAGSIDGKEYPVKEGSIERKVKFTRKGPRAVESISHLQNGIVEETLTTLSPTGKTLLRDVKVKLANGETQSWSEIYERK